MLQIPLYAYQCTYALLTCRKLSVRSFDAPIGRPTDHVQVSWSVPNRVIRVRAATRLQSREESKHTLSRTYVF